MKIQIDFYVLKKSNLYLIKIQTSFRFKEIFDN